MLHHVGDMVLQDFEGLLTTPVLIVLLSVAAQPGGLLGVPYETVTPDRHIVVLGKGHQLVGSAIREGAL